MGKAVDTAKHQVGSAVDVAARSAQMAKGAVQDAAGSAAEAVGVGRG